MEKAKYPIYDDGTLRVRISKGNTKIGNIPQFNLLPGDAPIKANNGTLLCNIAGTCGKHCKFCKNDCYAMRAARFHHNSCIPAWACNTLILRTEPEKIRFAINEYCRKNVVKYFRFHSSGELENTEHLLLYAQICKDNPEVTFYLYTKAFDILQDWFNELKIRRESIPDNFVINLSEWHGNTADIRHKEFFSDCNIFAYDDGEAGQEVEHMTHCPAVNKKGYETGITCAQCRRCMKKGNITAVYAH